MLFCKSFGLVGLFSGAVLRLPYNTDLSYNHPPESGAKQNKMDELTLKNLELLEKLGYSYEGKSNKFWSANHELYVNLPLMHCNDLVRVMNVIINFEKELAYNSGEATAQRKMRSALGL